MQSKVASVCMSALALDFKVVSFDAGFSIVEIAFDYKVITVNNDLVGKTLVRRLLHY